MSLTVAVVAFNGISPFHLSVPCIVFGEDRDAGGVPAFDLLVCADEPGTLTTTVGFSLQVEHSLQSLQVADIIVIPSWIPTLIPSDQLLTELVAAHGRGAQLVGLCLGAYVLAAAGLLDGRAATTHWAWAADFATRYPRVNLDAKVLYIDDGNLTTSAGTAAGIDCCLHVLRQRFGSQVASYVARRLVVPPHRQGSQAQFIDHPMPKRATGDHLAELLDWLRSHLDITHSLDALAARALMSRRTFTRRFQQLTGMTVGAWLLAERIVLAQRMLESTNNSIETIAQSSGFGSVSSLRQQFAASLGTSPSAYRRAFQQV